MDGDLTDPGLEVQQTGRIVGQYHATLHTMI